MPRATNSIISYPMKQYSPAERPGASSTASVHEPTACPIFFAVTIAFHCRCATATSSDSAPTCPSSVCANVPRAAAAHAGTSTIESATARERRVSRSSAP